MSKKIPWKINPEEVSLKVSSSARSGRNDIGLSKNSRSKDERSRELTLTHLPTRVSVSGAIPAGNYSKKEMKNLTDTLQVQLLDELERKVAKKLRISGMNYQ